MTTTTDLRDALLDDLYGHTRTNNGILPARLDALIAAAKAEGRAEVHEVIAVRQRIEADVPHIGGPDDHAWRSDCGGCVRIDRDRAYASGYSNGYLAALAEPRP